MNTIMKTILIMLATHFFAISSAVQSAEPLFDNKEASFDAIFEAAEGGFNDRDQQLESLWDRMEKEEAEKWQRLQKEVLQKWDGYRKTTRTHWVDYSPNREAVSQVNFDSGEVTVEALVPVNASKEQKTQAVIDKVKTLTTKEDTDGKPIMQDQLPKEALTAIEKGEVKLTPPKIIRGKDGVERVKVGINLKLVPNHIAKRAKRYLPEVKKQAAKHQVDPALILAIMHTESAFNPKARSHVPAYGLMQLVPRFGAKDAYQKLHGKSKVLSADYLYKPHNNIELGVVYLDLLESRYFKRITDPTKRRYVAVCAYNWGPTAMNRRLLPKIDLDKFDHEALFKRLQQGVPKETRDYLERVETRRKKYAGDKVYAL